MMDLIRYVLLATGAAVWAFWLLIGVGMLALWVVGKMMARRAGDGPSRGARDMTATGSDAERRGSDGAPDCGSSTRNAPAPAPRPPLTASDIMREMDRELALKRREEMAKLASEVIREAFRIPSRTPSPSRYCTLDELMPTVVDRD